MEKVQRTCCVVFLLDESEYQINVVMFSFITMLIDQHQRGVFFE